MSDHDAAPDPIDQAYVQAEAVLSDDEARAARRARVLAAVAREPVTPPAATFSSIRRPAWRRGGWLAAASIAGLGVFVAAHLYQPALRQPLTDAAAPAVQTAAGPNQASRGIAASPTRSAGVPSRTPPPTPRAFAAAPLTATPAPADVQPVAPPPPLLMIPPAPKAFPAAPAPAPPPPAAVVAAERGSLLPAPNDQRPLLGGASDEAVDAQGVTRGAAMRASRQAIPSPPPAAPLTRFESSARPRSDQAARLRAAAAAGRIAELETLLAQGVPVDTPDADGNTALMKSVKADHPAAAALLRGRGASLDHKNRAGESSRDIATAKGDPELNQALGLGP